MKNIIIGIIVVVALVSGIRWYNRPNNGIHGIGKNVCLIEGECVVINWNASEVEVEAALRRWQELKS